MRRAYKGAQERKAEAAAVRRRVTGAIGYTLLYMAVVTLTFIAVLGSLLWKANRLYVELAHPGNLKLFPYGLISFVLGGFIGFCVAVLTCERIHVLLLGPAPTVFSVEYFMATGPMPSMLRKIYMVAAISFCLIAVMNVRKYAVLTNSAIIDQRALALRSAEYPYSDIRQITMSRYFIPASKYGAGGVSTGRAMYVWLVGHRWSLRDSELSAGVVGEERLAQQLAERCHLTVDYPDWVIDLPDPQVVMQRDQLVVGISLFGIVAFAVWRLAHR